MIFDCKSLDSVREGFLSVKPFMTIHSTTREVIVFKECFEDVHIVATVISTIFVFFARNGNTTVEYTFSPRGQLVSRNGKNVHCKGFPVPGWIVTTKNSIWGVLKNIVVQKDTRLQLSILRSMEPLMNISEEENEKSIVLFQEDNSIRFSRTLIMGDNGTLQEVLSVVLFKGLELEGSCIVWGDPPV